MFDDKFSAQLEVLVNPKKYKKLYDDLRKVEDAVEAANAEKFKGITADAYLEEAENIKLEASALREAAKEELKKAKESATGIIDKAHSETADLRKKVRKEGEKYNTKAKTLFDTAEAESARVTAALEAAEYKLAEASIKEEAAAKSVEEAAALKAEAEILVQEYREKYDALMSLGR